MVELTGNETAVLPLVSLGNGIIFFIPRISPFRKRKKGFYGDEEKMMIGLMIILLLVLVLPFTVHKVEANLEIFLFVMGIISVFVSDAFSEELLRKALEDPVHITAAVLVAGLLFKWFRSPLEKAILFVQQKLPSGVFIALVVIVLGLVASVITAIIAALVLVLVASVVRFDRKSEILFTIFACFSIGLGAALTPIGEPLSTITVSKLDAEFFYLIDLVGMFVIPAVVLYGILAAVLIRPAESADGLDAGPLSESYKAIFLRTAKIYLFVAGLTLLGAGFEPFIKEYLVGLNPLILYWINIISATLDNATLAAAEISPLMEDRTIQSVLLGLIISGGMLIPGNIPNIIAAGRLNITSREWARYGVPIGILSMIVCFVILVFIYY
jgi:predicted cation transporter